jgi:D-alanyl-lipoteichoic acid acyltransferase DltB (MBOAT superfamily)
MLFNSYTFVFIFLPICLIGFFQLGQISKRLANLWLAAASIVFYSWGNPHYAVLILVSMAINYGIGLSLLNPDNNNKKIWLIFGIVIDLLIIGYYKYTNFAIDNWNYLFGNILQIDHFADISLPLGISFVTFTQIAFLVEVYRGEFTEKSFIKYCLFITYFPQLIAGPILHHQEVMPQFDRSETYSLKNHNLATGLIVFTIGLAKKVILADGVVSYVNPVFDAVKQGLDITGGDAWIGALAYTLQLYFDFSGYSDMAIGLGLMMGIKLPINFDSPYKAVNIVDFWRRWHITLSNFLRDYLYIPLGGNRHGNLRRYANLLITMLLGGLWHGAGWTFVIWGGLHGSYLVINHAWSNLRKQLGQDLKQSSLLGRICGRSITFFAVVLAWVFFRAETLTGGMNMITSMFIVPSMDRLTSYQFTRNPSEAMLWIGTLLMIGWFCPNTQQLLTKYHDLVSWLHSGKHRQLFNQYLQHTHTSHYFSIGMVMPLILLLVMISESQTIKEFIYFNF